MACPTCDHTMEAIISSAGGGMIGAAVFYHCPRCGTLKNGLGVYVPKLVERCREFKTQCKGRLVSQEGVDILWTRIGIAESINKPEDRQ